MKKTYEITPVAKPRMTRRDKWKEREIVLRYRAFKDRVKSERLKIPECGAHIIFHIPMPKSWSKEKRFVMCGRPHQQRPDLDNYLKGLFDAVMREDSGVWMIKATKLWAGKGAITISEE